MLAADKGIFIRRFLRRTSRRRAFTIVELLVVLAIVGVLTALLLPAVQAAREAARRGQCQNNIKQWSTSCLLHHETNGALPTAGWDYRGPEPLRRQCTDIIGDECRGPKSLGAQSWGWMYQVSPFVEEVSLWGNPNDQDVMRAGFSIASCPSRRPPTYRYAWTSMGELLVDYAGNGGDTNEIGSRELGLTPIVEIPDGQEIAFQTGTIILYEPRRQPPWSITNPEWNRDLLVWRFGLVSLAKIEDGTSKTLLIGEKWVASNVYDGGLWGDNFGWYQGHAWDAVRFSNQPPQVDDPIAMELNDVGEVVCYSCDWFGSAHPTGFNVSMADGSVRLIGYDVAPDTYRALSNRRDGRSINL